MIWTTTPWTIPSDQAVSLKPEAIYTAIEHDGRAEIMLKDLAEKVCGIAGWDVTPVMVDGKPYEVPAEVLDHLHYKQPVFDGVEGVALLADYVGQRRRGIKNPVYTRDRIPSLEDKAECW